MTYVDMDMQGYAKTGLVFYLFAIFCAKWAQDSGRSAWTWFFLGLFFAPITGLFLLSKHSDDRAKAAGG